MKMVPALKGLKQMIVLLLLLISLLMFSTFACSLSSCQEWTSDVRVCLDLLWEKGLSFLLMI